MLLQIALGAGYRHRAFGIMPHVIGAIVIGATILMFAIFVLVQFPKHDALRRSASSLAWITLVQLLLGVVAYFRAAQFNQFGRSGNRDDLVDRSACGFGALTMGATVVLAIQVLRHVGRIWLVSFR